MHTQPRKAKWGFKQADRIGARFTVLIGSEEASQNRVAVKCMATGAQEPVDVAALSAWMEERSKTQQQ
eukprot:10413-Eustigmatos_ZCMA.PRE.1